MGSPRCSAIVASAVAATNARATQIKICMTRFTLLLLISYCARFWTSRHRMRARGTRQRRDDHNKYALRFTVSQTSGGSLGDAGDLQQRIDIPKCFCDFPAEGRLCRDGGLHLLAHDPRQDFLPIFGFRRPAFALGPFASHRGIPIALVSSTQPLLLLCHPLWLSRHAGLRNQRQCRFFPFRARIDAEPHGYSLHGKADIKLPAL